MDERPEACPACRGTDTGVDALTHAIEAYVSRRANPFSDSLALAAMKAIAARAVFALMESVWVSKAGPI